MLALGQPLHAFDYDVLRETRQRERCEDHHPRRQGGRNPHHPGRRGAQAGRSTTLVCDTAGALSIAGVMGGAESEVTPETKNILLESGLVEHDQHPQDGARAEPAL